MPLSPPQPPAFTQSPEEVKGCPALLSDLSQGTDHPYFRLYQYLHQGAPHKSHLPQKKQGKVPKSKPQSQRADDCAAGPLSPRTPPGHRHDDGQSSALPPSTGSDTTPPPPPHQNRRGHAPSPPSANNRDKPLPPAPPTKAKPTSLAPPTYSGEADHLQQHVSLSNKRAAPSPGGHTHTRGPAPPPPPTSPAHRLTHPSATREAPPPPLYRTSGSPSLSSDLPARGKPPPPPPPSLRHAHASSIIPSLCDDFESKYLFHPLDDFPPPDEYRHFAKIYPSKAYSAMRGAPPLPPVGR